MFFVHLQTNETQYNTTLNAGAGDDTISYVVNSPVNIDGGSGTNTLALIGTEFADTFVVTAGGIFGYVLLVIHGQFVAHAVRSE
jgi:Ca2+-binding RTX toxin-like protein